MATNYYQLYIENTLALAETIVIKSTESAEAMNLGVMATHGLEAVDMQDPSGWKYYQNICGEYHFSDEMMYVTSLDTLENIEFTKENLSKHRATAKAYEYGNRHYREMVAKHPLQELLILGILYPADKAKALAAEDGDVLSYPSYLVEDNEASLIGNIEKWVKDFRARWYNSQFAMSDSLYNATHLGIMYLQLVPLILNLRLQACKTEEAHSYHIRQYLGSHGYLDEYLDFMNKKQALFFYRNIAYIERNSGKTDTFEWLVEKVLTERRIPLAAYEMEHNLEHLLNNYRPDVGFKKIALNPQTNTEAPRAYLLQEILDKERIKARGNAEYIAEHIPDIDKEFKVSLSDSVATKVLESNIIDYTDATPYTLEDILLNHWLWLAHKGNYSTHIGVKNPRTGARIPMTAKDAFVYYLYCWTKSFGITQVSIPSFPALRVRRIPTPSVTDVMDVVDSSYLDAGYVEELILRQPAVGSIISTEAFYGLCLDIYQEAQRQRGDISNAEHQYTRALLENAVNRLYCDAVCTLYPANTSYVDWLDDRYLPHADLTQADFAVLVLDIFKEATGIGLNTTVSLANLQRAMVSLMEKFSSYSIQFVTNINNSNIKVLNWAAIRPGDIKHHSDFNRTVDQNNIRVLDQHSKTSAEYDIDINYSSIFEVLVAEHKLQSKYDIKVKPKFGNNGNYVSAGQLMVGPLSMNAYSPLDDPKDLERTGMVGYYTFKRLDESSRSRLRSIYRNCFQKISGTLSDLTLILQTDRLSSFKHLGLYENTFKHFQYPGALGETEAYNTTIELTTIDTGAWLVPVDMVRSFSDEFEVMSLSIYKQYGLMDLS